MPEATFNSPAGSLVVCEEDDAITRLRWGRGGQDETALLRAALEQLMAYFAGHLTAFDLPLDVRGGPLQQQACTAMLNIPWGDTRTYGDLAKTLGVPAQSIGQACARNPIPVIVPCHRVLGAQGLGGFSGGTGVETKVWLLRHEGAASLLL